MRLLDKSRSERDLDLPKLSGILPVRKFASTFSIPGLSKKGMGPVREFPLSCKLTRFVRDPGVDGKRPVRELL